METIDQRTALIDGTLASDEAAQYWRAPGHDGLECLAAQFSRHRYAPHTHDTYVVGVILAGCETFELNGVRRYVHAGDVCFVHPEEVHDGEPCGDGYVYRMSYPSVEFLSSIASEVSGRTVTGTPRFRVASAQDPDTTRCFAAAHRLLGEGSRLAGDETLIRSYATMLSRYAGVGAAGLGREAGPVARVRDYLEAHLGEDVDLATLADVAGMSRFHLIRAFRRETGLTPLAWLTDRRVREARAMLAKGHAPGAAAAACGFADQSHLTRAFKARVGVTPGRFRAACLDHAA